MKHRLLSSFICLLVCLGAAAEAVSEWQARRTAIAFRSGRFGARAPVQSPTLVYTGGMAVNSGTRSVAGEATCYVYNFGSDGGFVIVSGEDCLMPVLAFAERGTFAVGEEMPDGVRGWLRSIDELVETCRWSGVASLVIDGMEINTNPEDLEIDVQPLLQSRWNQDAPYNNLCPLLATSASERSATGCAATAIAQIMYYHRWPESGTGTHTNNTNNVTVDFSASHYDWDLMRDTYSEGAYTEEEGNAVARLMHDVGMAANMAYDVESGTQNIYIYRALFRHFKYSSSLRYIQRGSLTTSEWLSTIRAELEAGRPVYYSGFAEDYSMGHAFVCDGITESDYYLHFNWGWSGNSDGFYFVNLLNPANPGIGGGVGRFNIEQVAIVGIQPTAIDESGVEKLPVLNVREYYRPAVYIATLGNIFRTTVKGIYNEGPEAATFLLAPALYKDGKFVQLVGTPQNRTLATFGGLVNLTVNVNLPEDTPEGDYQLRLVVSSDGAEWQEVTYYAETYQRYISLTVSGTTVTLHAQEQSGVKMQAVALQTVPTVAAPGIAYPVEWVISNSDLSVFNGEVGYALYALPGRVVEGISYFPLYTDTVLVASENQTTFLYGNATHKLTADIILEEEGEYLLQCYFTDPLSSDEVVLSTQTFTVPEPAVHYPRRVLMEQLHESATADDFGVLGQWNETYDGAFIPVIFSATESEIGYVKGYADSLDVAASGQTSFLNRRPSAAPVACEEVVTQLAALPAVASLEMAARFTNDAGGLTVEATLSSVFAYPMEAGSDCRFALLTLERERYEGSTLFGFKDVARGFWPADAFGGVPVSTSAAIGAGESVSATLTAQFDNISNLKDARLVGLLIHGRTGEVMQAVELPYSEIAPAEGEAVPTAVVWTDEDGAALMNAGIKMVVEACVMPRIAPQALVWSSSDPAVATVDGSTGIITTLSAGVTEIRASSAVNPALSAALTLTVQQPDYSQPMQVETGKLRYLLSGNGEQFILAGALNGTDIRHLRQFLFAPVDSDDDTPIEVPVSLRQHIDLSACSIVAGGEPYLDRLTTADNVVGERMFSDCPVLETLVLPTSAKSIGDNAFMGCGSLTGMEIPASVANIGYAPFLFCSDLQELKVAIGSSNFYAVDGVLFKNPGELIACPAAKEETVYTNASGATVTKILPYAFAGQRFLREFAPQTYALKSIGYGAFYGCTSLASVSVQRRLALIDDYAFGQCTALEKIVCEAETPPECTALAFSGVDAGACRLYVPAESISDYRTAPGWSIFSQWDDVAEAVETLMADGTAVSVCALGNGRLAIRSSQAGLSVAIYAPSGVLVAQAVTSSEGTELQLRLPSVGVYVVQLPGQCLKVLVK